MYRLKELHESSPDASAYAAGFLRLTGKILESLDPNAVASMVEVIETAGAAGRTIFTVGNGGSAAVASHFVNDMGVNNYVEGKQQYRVCCLADNVASTMAVANDLSYDEVFRQQLRCSMVAGDVVIAMSVSGNSENVNRAVEFANEAGGTTVGLCGFDGGRLSKLAHHVIQVKSSRDEYGPVEDVFSVICHAVSGFISMRRGRFLHH
jgi:D-sedoheptulose 7-phosphate isomerase